MNPTAPSRPNPQPPVRRPAPTNKSVYVRRRIIALIVILLILGLIALGIKSAYTWVLAYEDSKNRAAAEAAAAEEVVRPVNCDLKKINFSATPKTATGEVGAPFVIELKASNPNGTQPCIMDGSEDHLGIRVTSGDDLIWDSQKCAKKVKKQPLLLGTNVEYQAEVEWDAKQWSDSCQSGDQAGAGTYHVQAVLNGELVGKAETFSLK